MDKIKILIVDDQTLMREGLKTILSLEEDMEVVGLAENGIAAIELSNKLMPDVILMDIRMPVMNGVESTKEIRRVSPNIKIIILTTFDDDEFIIEALSHGASAYFLKDLPSDSLISSIRDAHKGVILMQPEIVAKLMASITAKDNISNSSDEEYQGLNKFTKREAEIYKLIKDGLSNKEIASKLFITEGTVKNYVSIIYDKLDVKDRTKAIFKNK
jgi:DNA-binding NarL/FixJ family response regulator